MQIIKTMWLYLMLNCRKLLNKTPVNFIFHRRAQNITWKFLKSTTIANVIISLKSHK